MSFIKRWFERLLWNSRFVVLGAVVASTVTLEVKTTLDLLYFGATVAFIGLALFLSHRAEQHTGDAGGSHAPPADGR